MIGPIFLIFVLMIIEVALYINAQITIDSVTREVARAVAVCGTTPGPWRYQRDPAGNWVRYPDCKSAAVAQEHLTYLPVNTYSTFTLAVCVGGDIPANGHCTSGYEQPTVVGQDIEVDVYYNYRYYIFPLLGEVGPSTRLTSSARVVAQQ